jgi:TPR repeat protein/CHAT domain-containing protein
MPRRLLIIPVFLLTLVVGCPVFSADFQKGVVAYNKEDYAAALREWKPLAEQGHSNAQFFLGLIYQLGQGVPQNYKTALKWLTLAAKQGYANAQNILGFMYYKGEGVPRDYETAVKWNAPAAEQGLAIAQTLLGIMYYNGQGVPQNYKTAAKWYKLAAEQGDANAQINLGKIHRIGQGVPQNYKTAIKWYSLAAEQGYAIARTSLGLMYYNGQGVPRDYKTAVKWYRLAAEQGYASAQYSLGFLYAKGRGVSQDNVNALRWWTIAASSGNKYATKNIVKIAKRMTPSEINTAQKLARNFVPSKSSPIMTAKKTSPQSKSAGEKENEKPHRESHRLNKVDQSKPERASVQSSELMKAYQQGLALYKEGQYKQAVPLFKKALRLGEKEFGANHRSTAILLNGLAIAYSNQGRYADAEPLYKRSLSINETILGLDHTGVATILNNFADLYRVQSRYNAAEPLYKRSLAIFEKHLGIEHPKVATPLNNLALVYQKLGRYADAERLYKRSLAITEKALGPTHFEVGASLINLASLYSDLGRYTDAEPLYKRSLTIMEKALGPEHPRVAMSLNSLAVLYQAQGRYADAEPLHKRSLAIREKALGPEHTYVATTLSNLALVFQKLGRYADAEPLYKRSLAINEKALGLGHLSTAVAFYNFASLYEEQGRYTDAEPLYKRSLTIFEKHLGIEHPRVATSLNNLAALYQAQGRYSDAEQLYKRSLSIREKVFGLNHPEVAASFHNIAGLYYRQRQKNKALRFSRRATAIHRERASHANERAFRQLGEHKHKLVIFLSHVRTAVDLAVEEPSKRVSLTSETFSVSQLARTTQTGNAVSRMAARFAASNNNLARSVRDHQDAIALWQKFDADLIKVISLPPSKRNPTREQALRDRLGILDIQIAELSKKLTNEFPAYIELAAAKPVSLSDVQNLLGSNEALIAYLVSKKKTYVWAVRQDRVAIFVVDIGKKALQDAVKILRSGFDEYIVTELSDLPPFDRSAAHKLFKQIFAPAEKVLKGASHVFIVPDGALQSLPLGVLVTKEPKGEFKDFSGYRQAPWLAKKYALTTLPSVSSLRALRTFAKRAKADIPFMGFGDPLLKGHPGGMRGISIPALYKVKSQKELSLADTSAVRNLPPLPETAGELRALSAAVKGDEKYIYLRKAATERTVKSIDLSNTRIITFATHGLVAGDLKNAEPALVLTPPAKGTALDDGLLTSSEVAQLKLNADLVILSACNTAAGDKADGAEGLSGLAKAFFYAGSRALLVSHWPVVSDAAVKLTTGMLKVDPAVGRAEALRRSMMALMNDKENPHYSHPLFWAPFVVVGEGGTYSAK